MKRFDSHRGALTICATLVILGGCGSSQTTMGVREVIPHGKAPAKSFRVLYRFAGGADDGAYPTTGLIDIHGRLYGTTSYGGLGCAYDLGCGTVYSVIAAGSETVLYRFRGGRSDGTYPEGALLDVKGALYGTTSYGGSGCRGGSFCGTVYGISTNGTEGVLRRFRDNSGGADPQGALIDMNGTLYGTTMHGGSSDYGTVYGISTTGGYKVLYRFRDGSDGALPYANLIAFKGILYGTTYVGGGSGCALHFGCGTIFSVSTAGKEKVLYRFAGGSDGANPQADLTYVNGTLYGTTTYGGSGCGDNGCGTVFSVSTTGVENVMHAFTGGSDGAFPCAGLLNVNGTLYGTTCYGGSGCQSVNGCGTIYSISTGGSEKVLHRFAGGSDGQVPGAALLSVNGTLYGTTVSGGSGSCGGGCGTVFALTP